VIGVLSASDPVDGEMTGSVLSAGAPMRFAIKSVFRAPLFMALLLGAASLACAQQAPSIPSAPPNAQLPTHDVSELIYSPWMKFCLNGADASAKPTCFTGREARAETGRPVTAAVLLEPEGQSQKSLRVTVPNPVLLRYGVRIYVDQSSPQTASFVACFVYGCFSEVEVSPDTVLKLKGGQTLFIQTTDLRNQQVTFQIPLADFKKINEGPPTDPSKLEEQVKSLQDELQKRAADIRKRLPAEAGQQAPK
jgi:invasion protein IalB